MSINPPIISEKNGLTEETPTINELPPVFDFVSATGPLLGTTINFGLNLTNFNWLTWHTYEWQNWTVVDTLLNAAIGFLNLQGVWRAGTDYTAGQTVLDPTDLTTLFLCMQTHTAGQDWAVDEPLYWEERIDSNAPVTSVHARIGDVVGVLGDYSAALITYDNTGTGLSATQVQAALNEINTAVGALSTSKLDVNAAASTYLTIASATSTYLTIANAASTYLPLAGGTLTGALTVDNSSDYSLLAAKKNTSDGVAAVGFTDENDIARAVFELDTDDSFNLVKYDSIGTGLGNVFVTNADGLDVIFGGYIRAQDEVYIDANAGSAYLYYRDSANNNRAQVYWSHTNEQLLLQTYTSGGVTTGVFIVGSLIGAVRHSYSQERIASLVGYLCKSGSGGGFGGNTFNFQWNASVLAAYIDTTNFGEIRNSQISDMRVKREIAKPEDPKVAGKANQSSRQKINSMSPMWFRYKGLPGTDSELFQDDGRDHYGFSANAMLGIMPEAVIGEINGKTPDNKIQPLMLDPKPMLAHTIGALQEVDVELQEARTKINELEARIAALESA